MDKMGYRVSFILLFALFTLPVSSQVENSQFTGIVTDPTEAAIVGARVTVRNMDTGYRLNLHTNGAGLFVTQDTPTQLTIYGLALARRTSVPLKFFKCGRFDEKDYSEFFPLQGVYKRRD